MISRENILEIKSRRDIYLYISKHPGLHINELSLKMNIPRSTLVYHLRCLMKLDVIHFKGEKKEKRFYVCGQMGIKDKELLGLLRQEIPFKIIMYFFYPGYCSEKELAEELKLHPSTIYFHLKKLLELGVIQHVEEKDGKLFSFHKEKLIVCKKPVKREIFYMWKSIQMKRDVYRLLITHKKSLLDPSIIDSYEIFVREIPKVWLELKQVFSFNKTVDNILDVLEKTGLYPYYPL